ncbi:MAG: NAD(P)/FAD-dependent oxidoreductase [Acidimicrobiia bacterium]|nr:NAD(P)/FAD-dependent oxidoreductase [Acidimicrobiia bacterium]
MKRLLVLGAGTAGTVVVNKLRPRLDPAEWQITIVDQSACHHYQPGYLFIPFGIYRRHDVEKPRRDFIPAGVDMVMGEIEAIDPERQRVSLAGGRALDYDYLVIATGTHPTPSQTPGFEGEAVGSSIHQYYTLDGAVALYERLKSWEGGRMVVNIMEFPFKCPVAPLEFTFLADWWFREHGRRDKVEIVFATPMSEVFTKPVAARHLTGVLQSKDINVETDFYVERIDADAGALVAYDGRELPYDLLVTVPVNMGAEVIARSGLGDELNHVPVDKGTFLSTKHPNIFALGDAAALPTSKAGSVAHFSVEIFAENFPRYAEGLEMLERFDGHANCFIESGFGKGLLIDFNYDTEPLPGKYPLPGIGPFSLLQETVTNHWGKMMFRWVYWNLLLRGREIPLPSEMSMYGKER